MIYLQFGIYDRDFPLKMLYGLPKSVVNASDVVLSKTVDKRAIVSVASVVFNSTVEVTWVEVIMFVVSFLVMVVS